MTELLMFEVDVKNVMEKGRGEGGGDQLGFGVLIVLNIILKPFHAASAIAVPPVPSQQQFII